MFCKKKSFFYKRFL